MEDLEHAALQENLASGGEFTRKHTRGGPPPPPLPQNALLSISTTRTR